jgi:hypothetical protein
MSNNDIMMYIASKYAYLRSCILHSHKKLKNRRIRFASVTDTSVTDASAYVNVDTESNIAVKDILNDIIEYAMISSDVKHTLNNIIDDAIISNEVKDTINDMIDDVVALSCEANIYEMDINMEDSWSITYDINNVKIFHCHVPIVSNDSDNDDF